MIVVPFQNAADGIAREEALLKRAEPAVLIWQTTTPSLVVPSALARLPALQAMMAETAQQGWPVVTRRSGGGIVPQGPSTLNLAFVMPQECGTTIEDGYRLITGVLTEALSRFDISTTIGACPGAFCDGDWNVLAEGRKLVGTAQRWAANRQSRIVLAHASILMEPPELTLWPVLKRLSAAAFPEAPAINPEAHIALAALLPGRMSLKSFPSALARAAAEPLSKITQRKNQAA